MKKHFILALIFATICATTLICGLIYLDTVTTLLVWGLTSLSITLCLMFFALYYSSKYQNLDDGLEKAKEKITKIKNTRAIGKSLTPTQKLQRKGIREGLRISLEIIEEVQNEKTNSSKLKCKK